MKFAVPLKIILAAVISLSVGACSSVAPVWPLAGRWTPPLGYGDLKNCPNEWVPNPPGGGNEHKSDDQSDLQKARTDIVCLAQKYAGEERNIEIVRNGETISLFGLGTTAGINVVQHAGAQGASQISGNNQLQRLGLAAAALLGFNQAVGIDGQHAIYDSGVVALQCVMQTDLALDATHTAQQSLRKSLLDPSGVQTALQWSSNRTLMDKLIDERNTNKTNSISEMGVAAVSQATLSISDTDTVRKRFEADLGAAIDKNVRVPTLMYAAFQINHSVENALYKNVDPSTIVDAMKSGVQKLAGKPAASAQQLEVIAEQASTRASLFELLPSSYSADITTEKNALALAVVDNGASQTLADTYQQCITGMSSSSTAPKS